LIYCRCSYLIGKEIISFPNHEHQEIIIVKGNLDEKDIKTHLGIEFSSKLSLNFDDYRPPHLQYCISCYLLTTLLLESNCFSIYSEEQSHGVIAQYSSDRSCSSLFQYLELFLLKNITIGNNRNVTISFETKSCRVQHLSCISSAGSSITSTLSLTDNAALNLVTGELVTIRATSVNYSLTSSNR